MAHAARIFERKDFLAPVKLSWESANNCRIEDSAMIQDRSAGGFGIHVRQAVPVGTNVSVTHSRNNYYGVVRHCAKVKELCLFTGRQQFLIGIEFLPSEDVKKAS